jgi:DNA polymerase I
MKKPLLVLVDGSAVFHRGYHAIPHLSNKEGLPTNAVLGFATILLKVMQDLKPQYVIVTWDKGDETTLRKQKYPEYKATRKKQPDDLYAQIPLTRELVAALNLPWLELAGYEADDLIGTLAAQAERRGGLDTVIVTGDLDELQLVGANTRVYTMKRGFTDTVIYDLVGVKARYGVTPAQFIDVKALKGDASDNIPGVPGVGEKTAMELIASYGSLDEVYSNLDALKPALRAKLEAGKDLAYLSQDLSTIMLDVPGTELDLEAAQWGKHDRQKVYDLFRRLEFKSLLTRLPEELKVESSAPTLFGDAGVAEKKQRAHLTGVEYEAITTEEALDALVAELSKQLVFALDTETTSVDELEAQLVGISVAFREGEAFYIPVAHENCVQLERDLVLKKLKPLFENPKIGKVGHNIKYDYEILRRQGIKTAPLVFDTMVAAFLLNSLGRAQSLDDLAYSELGVEMIPITELIGAGKKQVTFDKCLLEDATMYAAEDADMSMRLYRKLRTQLDSEDALNEWGWSLKRLGDEIEWPIIPVLGEMELAGIELDVGFLEKAREKFAERIGELKERIYELAGEEFNIGSPAQLGQILYGRLGLSTVGVKKGKTGHSTAAGELEKMRDLHPIIDLIMQFRELDKLQNTYVVALPGQVGRDGRVHTSFSQVIAQTGRLSSSNPNLMNIPVRTELGREIRQAFVAPEGRVLVSADYSQIELRVAAALSGDEAMKETFRQGEDLHAVTAAELYSVPLDQVTKEMRYNVKAVNFGVLYGMSPHGLSVATGMDGKEAAAFIDRYWELRPKLKAYIEATKKFAYEHEYTATLFGRRRPCPEIKSNNFVIRSATERMAVNVPIQGTAADIYKLGMIELARRLDDDCRLLLQIHDELIVEAPKAKAKAVEELMRDAMSVVIDLGVPLAVDTAGGTNWGEL